MNNDTITSKNETLKKHSKEAQISKGNSIDHADKKFHKPNRPST